jgi:hypothetical protein
VKYRDEDKLQAAVIKAILAEWPDAWSFHPLGGMYQKPGIPDLLLCVNGLLIGIELKNPHPGESDQAARERTTPLQRKEIRAINRAGGTARTAITVAEAVATVRAALVRAHQRASE